MSFSKAPEFDPASQALAHLIKALTHPCRLRILFLLARTRRCPYKTIEASMPLHRSTVSKHLKYLRKRNLIDDGTDGKHTWYSLRQGRIAQFIRKILNFFRKIESSSGISGKLQLRGAILACLNELEIGLRPIQAASRAPP